MTTQRYLLDELETADMLEIDGLHAWRFELNENLLDQADLAAEADQPFASEDWCWRWKAWMDAPVASGVFPTTR